MSSSEDDGIELRTCSVTPGSEGGMSHGIDRVGVKQEVSCLRRVWTAVASDWFGKLMYLVYCGAAATWVPFLVVLFDKAGISPSQMGAVLAVRPLMSIVAGPVWGVLSDTRFDPRSILIGCSVGLCVLRACFFLATVVGPSAAFWVVLVLSTGTNTLAAPMYPLMDAHVYKMLGDDRRLDWGTIRCWGAVSWGIVAWLTGILIDNSSLDVVFPLHTAAMLATSAVLFRLPRRKARKLPGGRQTTKSAGTSKSVEAPDVVRNDGGEEALSQAALSVKPKQGTVYARLRALFSRPEVLLFLAIIGCMGTCMGIIASFLLLHLEQMGAPSWLLGFTLTITTVGEIPMLHYSGALITRFGVISVLAAALVCYEIRLVWYANLTNAYWVLPVELLHGVTYGAGWAAGTNYAATIAPKGLEGTMQSLVTASHWGIGFATGSVVGGLLFDFVGAARMFLMATSVAGLGLALCVFASGRVPGCACGRRGFSKAYTPVTSLDVEGDTRERPG